jgi:hypothetical protein
MTLAVRRSRAWILGALTTTVSLPLAGNEPVRSVDELEERARVRVHTARVRIEPTSPARPGECLDLGVADLKVWLRGERVEDANILELERSRPELIAGWREDGYRVVSIDYDLTSKPAKHDPVRAFREIRLTVELEADRGKAAGSPLSLTAELSFRSRASERTLAHLEVVPAKPARTGSAREAIPARTRGEGRLMPGSVPKR